MMAPEYTHKWKTVRTPGGRDIPLLRASGRRTSGKGCSGARDGWPKTPQASDGDGGVMEIRPGTKGKYKLRGYAQTVGWPTPQTFDQNNCNGNRENRLKKGGCSNLREVVMVTGWPTVTIQDAENNAGPSQYNRNSLPLNTLCQLTTPEQSGGPAGMENGDGFQVGGYGTPRATEAIRSEKFRIGREPSPEEAAQLMMPGGWATPRAGKTTDENPETWQKRKDKGDVATMPLTTQAQMTAGYPTPRTITGGPESAKRKQELGRTESGGGDIQAAAEAFRMPDMTGWKLNPAFSLYLMGYPKAWMEAGEKALS